MSTLTFAPCEDGDRPIILEMCMELVRAYEDPAEVPIHRALDWEKRKLAAGLGHYTRIMIEGAVVGYYALEDQGARLELDDLYILPEFRGRGYGSQTLEHILAGAEKPVYLYVFTANTGAVRLYRRFGFAIEKKISGTRSILLWEPERKSTT